MTISELSYLYDVLRGFEGIIMLFMAGYFMFVGYEWSKYFVEKDYSHDDEFLTCLKKKAFKHTIFFILILFVITLLPSPRTIVIYEIEKNFDKKDVKFIIEKILKKDEGE